MYAQVEKPKEKKSRAVANSVAQKQSIGKPPFQFVDNGPEAISQKKMQIMADYSSVQQQQPNQKKESNTVLPGKLKSGNGNIKGHTSFQATQAIQRNVIIKNPERNYDNLNNLVQLVRNAILSVVDQHKEEPFYQRVFKDIKFFFQIVEELFVSNPVYDKMKDFTDEIIQTGLAKSDFNPAKYTKEEWALLHRMESQSFRRFVDAKEEQKHEEGIKATYEETYSKYNPLTFDSKHTWKGNTQWLIYVLKNFSKLVLTDIPITINNIFRQKTHTSMFAKKGERDFNVFSAYGREIAALLYEGYVPISSATVGESFEAPVSAITMVNAKLLPPTVLASVLKRVKVNREVAKWIAKGNSSIGLGKKIDEKTRVQQALSFFHHAGIITDIEIPSAFVADTKEHRELSWASRDLQPEDHEKEARLQKERELLETRKQEQSKKAKSYAFVESSGLVIKIDDFIRLIREAYIISKVEDPKNKYNHKSTLENLLSDGKNQGLISPIMSKNKLTQFIKENRDKIWPQ